MRRCRGAGWLARCSLAPLALVLLSAACTDDEPPPGAGSGDAPLEFDDEPIRLGFVNTERGALPVPAFRFGAEVAVEAINADGGVRGAPIELVDCAVDGSADASARCARRLVDEGVAAVVVGFDVAADAMVAVLAEAGVPFVGVNSTGPAQRSDPIATILHTAPGAFDLAAYTRLDPAETRSVGVIVADQPEGRRYLAEVVGAVAEGRLGLDVTEVLVDPVVPDLVGALGTLADAGVDAIHAELDDIACLSLIDAARRVETPPISTGPCRLHLELASSAAVGTIAEVDIFTPRARGAAPPEIAERLDRFVDAMIAAGHERLVGGYSASTYGAMFELAEILRRAEAPVGAASLAAALDDAVVTPGWFGPDLRCGEAPFPDEPNHCRADVAAVEVTDADGDGEVEFRLLDDFAQPLDDLE